MGCRSLHITIIFFSDRDCWGVEASAALHLFMRSANLYHQTLCGKKSIYVVATEKRKRNMLRLILWLMNLSVNSVKHRASKSSINGLWYSYLCWILTVLDFRGHNAKTPEYFEDLFCNLGCYEEYRIRTSNRSLRQVSIWNMLFEII